MPQDFDPDAWMAKQKKGGTKPEPATGADFDPDAFMAKEAEARRPAKPATVLPQDRQTFGRRPVSLDESLTQSARFNRGKPAPSRVDMSTMDINPEGVKRAKREAFERKPITEQLRIRATDALTRGGGQVSRMARQTMGAIGRLAPGNPSLAALPAWQQGEEGRFRTLEQRRQDRPSSFGTETFEGALEALPAAGLAALGGIATGGSLPAAAAIGGGMAAAGADWQDPKRAAVQTALGAVAPMAGGVVGSRLGSAVASRLARPAAQGAARAGGEVLGGAAGNVIGTGAEQLAFEGGLNPRALAQSGIIGGALNVPGAIGAARRPARLAQNIPESIPAAQPVTARQPEAAPVAPRIQPERRTAEIPRIPTAPTGRISTQPQAAPVQPQPPPKPQGRVVRVGDRDYTLTPEQEARWKTEVDEPLAQAAQRAKDFEAFGHGRQEAAKMRKGVAMRVAAKKREILGAFTPKEEAARAAREATNYRGKPVSVEGVNGKVQGMSFGRVRVQLEDGRQINVEPAKVAQPVPPPRTPRGAIIAQPSSLPSRKLLPPGSPDAPETARIQYPDAPETQEMPEIRARIAAEEATTRELPQPAIQEPTNRITEGEGAELPRRVSPQREGQPIESLRQPKATDENIAALRAEQEQLSRLAYDRRGDLTGDLRDRYNRLNSIIREYDNARAPRELAPPPSNQPERFTPPAGERQARREALQPKTGPMPETLTEGRKVTQEVQIPPALKPAEAFSSREDARQGHFERFNDEELVGEIRRMEEIQNQAVGGRSKLSREQLEANRFDLKVAKDMQIERGRLQRQIGVDAANRIAPRTPGRTFKKHPEAAPEAAKPVEPSAKEQEALKNLNAVIADMEARGVLKPDIVSGRAYTRAMKQHERRILAEIKGRKGARMMPPDVEVPKAAEAPEGRKIQHSTLGEVTEAADQSGVPKGKLRVVDEATGKLSVIQNPRTKGNREAAFVKGPTAEPVAPMQTKPPDLVQGMKRIARSPSSPVEISQLRAKFPKVDKATFDAEMTRLNEQGKIALHRHDHPASLSQAQRDGMVRIGNDYFSAATFREAGGGEIMGMGLGALQGMFKGKGKTPELGRLQRQPQQQALFDAAARSPWQDSVLAYYRANLLTNPVGRAADLGSTVINQFADAAVRPIAAAVDVFVSKLTGKRSITGPSIRGTGRAFGSIGQGMRDAGEVLRTGKQPIDSGADDALYGSEIRTGLGKAADVPINGVFRVLGAMDAPFRRFGFERNLADRARVAAINEAKAGRIQRSQIKSRAAELVDRDDIINAAVRDGEKAVLADPNRISSWLAKQTANSPNTRLAIGIVQPFMRIPLNAVLKSADFAGVGGVKALYKIARGGVRKARGRGFFENIEEQRVFAQNVAAGSFAPAAFLLGMELEEQGKLEGYYYTSKKDFPSGKTPTSIEFGGERYDINRLGGFIAAPLFIGATYSRLRKQDVGQADALLRSFSGLAQQAPALGHFGAPAKAGRILTADEPGEELIKEAGSITSGFIPASGALGAAAKAMDQNRKRETPGFTGPIMNRIPGLRGQLPERKHPRNLSFTGGIAQEFRKHGLDFSRVDRIPGDTEETHRARGTKVEGWITEYGGRLIDHPRYKTLSPAQQKAALENLRRRIGEQANQRRPDLRNFRPMEVFRSVRESERARPRRDRGKLVVGQD